MFTSITDLVALTMFLGISPAAKEAMTSYFRNDDKKDLGPYKTFLKQTALIQRDAMIWMLECALKIYKPDAAVFPPCLHKILFMVASEEYWRVDGWPDEPTRGLYLKATSEIPLMQDTLCHIFVIGISKAHPINGRDIIDLVECLVKRAAALHPLISEDFQVLSVDRVQQVMEFLFQLAAYFYPDTIILPKDYHAPKMAIGTAYWKAWQILVLLCAHNPSEFGAIAWENYPTLRAMMEMCITNQFQYPPPTLAIGDQADEIRAKDVQTTALEKQDILQFEIHLAAATNKATITEASSLLLAQLITNNPDGDFRRPPQAVLDQLAHANQLNKIGHLLCRSRNPDFLLDILQRQGSNQAMPWLADLVESSEGSFNVLPVQCLCEFLLNSTTTGEDEFFETEKEAAAEAETKQRKQKQLLLHLQNLVQHPTSEEQQRAAIETLDYFMRRLSSQQTHQRLQALKGLRLVLSPIENAAEGNMDDDVQVLEEPDNDPNSPEWLLKRLPRLPCFANYYPQISNALRFACQVENDPLVVSMYIQFLAHYAPDSVNDLADLCLDISSIIVERSTLLPAILPGSLCKTKPLVANDTYLALLRLFIHYMGRVRRRAGQQPLPQWGTDVQEMIMVHWATDQVTATIHFFIVHAQIILLTYGPQTASVGQREGDMFAQLLHIWQPPRGDIPRAYMVESNKEVVLIPDWLKLKMIRSDVGALVDAALQELDPQQLVLFIQSFGIPVQSMSKLLRALDRTIQTDYEGVNEAVMDKTYMGQLVAVQHQRGATGGQVFADALGLNLAAHKSIRSLEPPRPSSRMTSGHRPLIVVPPRSTAMIPPGHVKSTLLHLFDVGSPSRMTLKEKRDTFRTLQKYLTSEIGSNTPTRPMLEATVKALEAIIVKASDLREAFVASILQHTSFSASLLRLLTSALTRPSFEDSAAATTMLSIAEAVLSQTKKREAFASSPIWRLLEEYKATMSQRVNPTSSSQKGQQRSLQQQKKAAEQPPPSFERSIQIQVEAALKKKDTRSVVDSMAKMLLKEDSDSKNASSRQQHSGIIIDWLQLLDPELKQARPEIRKKLLFSASSGQDRKNPHPHMLTLLSHLADWHHLKATIDGILDTYRGDLDPKAVLDFLSTCVYLQMQWQCNDTHTPKHDTGPQDVLKLSGPQILVVLDYAISEAVNVDNVASRQTLLQGRIPLLISCLNDKHKATTAMDYLITRINDEAGGQKGTEVEAVKDLILQIYMQLPQSLVHMVEKDPNNRILPGSIGVEHNTSVVDPVSHFLLSALSTTQQGRGWTDQMKEFEAAARKLAAKHPVLLLRNLPLLAAGMKGRTDYDFSFFRSRNHMTFYSMALGLLEVMSPLVFQKQFKKALQDCLGCFMIMFKNYYQRRESFIGVVEKVVTYLHLYLEAAPQDGAEFIANYRNVLGQYFKAYPASPALLHLSRIVSLDNIKDGDQDQEISNNDIAAAAVVGAGGGASISGKKRMKKAFCQILKA
jgi:integrator complex subunit 1